jgi:hypothetical protein
MHRLLALTICVAACGGASSSSQPTTPGPTAAPPFGSAPPCGYDILASAKDKGGACLEPAVLGADVTKRCEAYLQQNGWQRDGVAESAIGEQTGKAIVCFRAPESEQPAS